MNETANVQSVEIPSDYAVLELPQDCVEVKLTCKVYRNGELITVERTLGPKEVAHAVREAEECYIPDDAVFTLTDKGRELAWHLDK